MTKLWVDDERPAPDNTWIVAKTSADAIMFLREIGCDASVYNYSSEGEKAVITEVSLDHDLGGEDTGFKVLDWMISYAEWPDVLTIHTSNPPARKRMLAAANAEAPRETEIFVIHDHLDKR